MAIEVLRGLFQGSSANLVRHGPDIGTGDLITTGNDPIFHERFITEFADATNPFIQAAMLVECGRIFTDRTLFDREALRRSRYWNEWMAPQDMYGGMFCKIWMSDSSIWAFNVQRGRKQDEFGHAEIELLEHLLPHLTRAMRINRDRQTARALVTTFFQLPFGVLLVGADQRVIEANELAAALLSRPGSRLRIEAGRLVSMAANTTDLRKSIDVARRSRSGETACGIDHLIRQPAENGRSDNLMVTVMPLADTGNAGPAWEPMAAIIIREIAPRLPEGFDAHLRAIFNLTPAEARLATNLCAGQSLKVSAELQDIRFSTARHYLEGIFQKTGTRRQSQLVALLKNVQPLQRR